MKAKALILALFAIYIFSSCEKEKEDFVPISITPVLIGQSEINGEEGIEKQNFVIKTQTEWDDLKARMDKINPVSNKFTEANIDFNTDQIIAVFSEQHTTGGHSIDIVSITERSDNILVVLKRLLKGNDSPVMTQVFHIVRIPKSSKPIFYENQ